MSGAPRNTRQLGDMTGAIRAALTNAGVDVDGISTTALAPVDEFHIRGVPATLEIAEALAVDAGSSVLDNGSGLGGPARTIAEVVGCHVIGIDLTPEFCATATELSRCTGLSDRTQFAVGDATSLDLPDATFDAAMSVHVAMNIADKAGMYREARRVLKPGGASLSMTFSRAQAGRCTFRCRGPAIRRRATSPPPSRLVHCSPAPASR